MNRCVMMLVAVAMAVTMLPPLSADAHVLKLKDGRIVKGEFVSATSQVVRFRVSDEVIEEFLVSDILSIHFSMASIAAPQAPPEPIKVNPGTVVRVRLDAALGTLENNAGERFFASLEEDIVVDDVVLANKGGRVFGRVRKVVKPKRSIDKSVIELVLTHLTIQGKEQPIITDYFGVQNDGHGTVSVLGTAKAPELTVPEMSDGKHVGVPKSALLEFRITQPITLRDVKR